MFSSFTAITSKPCCKGREECVSHGPRPSTLGAITSTENCNTGQVQVQRIRSRTWNWISLVVKTCEWAILKTMVQFSAKESIWCSIRLPLACEIVSSCKFCKFDCRNLAEMTLNFTILRSCYFLETVSGKMSKPLPIFQFFSGLHVFQAGFVPTPNFCLTFA